MSVSKAWPPGDYEERNMTEALSTKSKTASGCKMPPGRLFVIELSGDRIFSMNTDGSNRRTIVTGCRYPDGLVVDTEAGHIYWTNMGIPSQNDGSIERVDFDGKNRKVIGCPGVSFTPKQIHLVKKAGKLYWCDREGMRVMRCELDGSQVETLVEAGRGDADRLDQTKWCIGITIDPSRKQIYWTQKGPDNAGRGRLFRANIEIPKGETAANRTDIEVFFDRLPEPIDLDLIRGEWTMTERPIRRIAVIGTGVIGASWTALFLAKGLDVVATDIAPDVEASLRRFVDMAWPALKRLGLAPNASQSRLTFTADFLTAVKGAELGQGKGP